MKTQKSVSRKDMKSTLYWVRACERDIRFYFKFRHGSLNDGNPTYCRDVVRRKVKELKYFRKALANDVERYLKQYKD